MATHLRAKTYTRLATIFIFFVCLSGWFPLSFSFLGLNLRPSQILLPFVLYLFGIRGAKWQMSPWTVLLFGCGALYWAALLGWTIIAHQTSLSAIAHVILVGLNLLHMVAGYIVIRRIDDVGCLPKAFIDSAVFLNLILVFVTIGVAMGLPVPDFLLQEEAAPVLINGVVVDAMVLRFKFGGVLSGCFSAAISCLAACLLLLEKFPSPYQRILFGLLLGGIGIVLGFSRQAMICLIGGLLPVIGLLLIKGRILNQLKIALTICVMLACSFFAMRLLPGGEQFLQAFNGRVAQLFQSEYYSSGTASSRTIMWTGMLDDIRAKPFLGAGQDAYKKYYVNANGEGSHNGPLEVMHATGVWGFIPWLFLHLILMITPLRTLLFDFSFRNARHGILLAFFAASIACILASLTNLIFWNPAYWVFLGCLAGSLRNIRLDRRRLMRGEQPDALLLPPQQTQSS